MFKMYDLKYWQCGEKNWYLTGDKSQFPCHAVVPHWRPLPCLPCAAMQSTVQCNATSNIIHCPTISTMRWNSINSCIGLEVFFLVVTCFVARDGMHCCAEWTLLMYCIVVGWRIGCNMVLSALTRALIPTIYCNAVVLPCLSLSPSLYRFVYTV